MRPAESVPDERPAVAIFRSPVFHAHETFVQAHAAGLRRYRPLIVGLEDKGHVPPALAESVLLLRSARQRTAFKLLGRAGALAGRMRPFAPVLIHAHFGPDGLMALPLARSLGVPLVTTLHGYDVSRTAARMLASGRLSWIRYALFKRRLTEGGDLFLAVSEALRDKAIAAGYPPERTLTHYNGVDLAAFRAGAGKAEPGLILHVGRLVEKKGTRLLIRALAEVRGDHPRARLVVLGDGPLRARLEAEAAALGVAASVQFLGNRPQAEVAAWMARAWLLAAPSVTAGDGDAEGLPTVIVEAAASGVPVIGADHSGIPEAVIEGKTGFIVPEGAVEPLARRIAELVQAPRLRNAMGRAGRAMAEERFDGARQTSRLETHYDQLVSRARDAGGAR